jgi:(p)ppGpp synthase/HD superfamily hydrolase
MSESEPVRFLPDFESALTFAARLHSPQPRKGSDIPYVAHLLSVAALVLEYGGGRDEAIAALLHDSIEDQGNDYPGGAGALRAKIAGDFGLQVLAIVEGCTDADTVPKPPWRKRKERYIAHVRHASDAIRLVSCADKLHNARTIVADLREIGPAVFERFKGGRDGTLWYYESLAAVFTEVGPKVLAAELHRTVTAMKALSAG